MIKHVLMSLMFIFVCSNCLFAAEAPNQAELAAEITTPSGMQPDRLTQAQAIVTQFIESKTIAQEYGYADSPAMLISSWFAQNQSISESGLVTSYPDDNSFIYHEGVQQEWA